MKAILLIIITFLSIIISQAQETVYSNVTYIKTKNIYNVSEKKIGIKHHILIDSKESMLIFIIDSSKMVFSNSLYSIKNKYSKKIVVKGYHFECLKPSGLYSLDQITLKEINDSSLIIRALYNKTQNGLLLLAGYVEQTIPKSKIDGILISEQPIIIERKKKPTPDITNKNIFSASWGTFLLGINGCISFERLLKEKQKGSFWIKSSFGYINLVGDKYIYPSLAFTYLKGNGPNKLEGNIGAAFLIGNGEAKGWPVISLGYRRHKPNKKFIFRTGVSTLEMLYLSIGLSF